MIVQTGDLFVQPHFRRIKNGPKPMLGVIFYLAEKGVEQHGRPQATSNQPGNLEESLPTRLDEHPQNLYTIRSRRNTK